MRKNILLYIFVVGGFASIAVAVARQRRPASMSTVPDLNRPASMVPRGGGPSLAGLAFYDPLRVAMRRGDDRAALRMVDDALAGGYRRVGVRSPGPADADLHTYRVQILSHAGEDAALVDEALGLFRGRFGSLVWSPGPRGLEPALMAAVRLGNAKAVDVIATRIDTNPGWHVTDYPFLNPEWPGRTPAKRLAYAYITLSMGASGDMDYAKEVQYCEAARALAPDEVPVLVRLADAYIDRRDGGDRDRAQAAYRRAYALLPAEGNARRDLRVLGSGLRLDPAPPGAKTTLEQDVAAYTAEGPIREAARQRRLNEGRARMEAERAAPLRPSGALGGSTPHF